MKRIINEKPVAKKVQSIKFEVLENGRELNVKVETKNSELYDNLIEDMKFNRFYLPNNF